MKISLPTKIAKLFFALFIFILSTHTLKAQIDRPPKSIRDAIEAAVEDRMNDFLYVLEEIAEKSESNEDRQRNRVEAISYFTSSDARIEVSSKKNPKKPKSYSIREYLFRLDSLPYDRIEMDVSTESIQDLREDSNGRYRVNGIYRQSFKGYINGKPYYADITWKMIDVIVVQKRSRFSDQVSYDIKFNHIKVIETR